MGVRRSGWPLAAANLNGCTRWAACTGALFLSGAGPPGGEASAALRRVPDLDPASVAFQDPRDDGQTETHAAAVAAAIGVDAVSAYYDSILDLALAMASYTGGALIAAFFLAFLPTGRDGSGFAWSAALSVMSVFAVVWHVWWATTACSSRSANN